MNLGDTLVMLAGMMRRSLNTNAHSCVIQILRTLTGPWLGGGQKECTGSHSRNAQGDAIGNFGNGFLNQLGESGNRVEALKVLEELKQESTVKYIQNYDLHSSTLGSRKEEA
jgi:hypothetical protein